MTFWARKKKDRDWGDYCSKKLERDAKRCRGKTRIDELTASLTTLITDCLRESTEKVRVSGRSKQ